MADTTALLVDALAGLADDHDRRINVRDSSGKGALTCGGLTLLGGLLAGTVGMALGGTLGTIVAWQMSLRKWRSFFAGL